MEKFIIVGAGIAGTSVAYHLAKRNFSVTIIDRGEKGQATDAAAGIICPWLSQRRNKNWYQLAKNGAAYYPTLIKSLEADGETNTGYHKVGALSIHTEERKLDAMVKRAIERRQDAPEIGLIEKLSAKQTKEAFPILRDDYQSVYTSGAARVNGSALNNALLNAAIKRGASFISGDATLVQEKNQATGINVHGQFYKADKIIITTGAWMNELHTLTSVPFQVTSQKAQIMHLNLPNFTTHSWPVVMPPNNQYMLTYPDNRIIVGTTHENNLNFDRTITAGSVQKILTMAIDIAPSLASSSILESRVGFRPFTPGFLPLFGELPNVEGAFFANGLGASGLTMGPYIGLLLTSMVLEEDLDIDVSPYSVRNLMD